MNNAIGSMMANSSCFMREDSDPSMSYSKMLTNIVPYWRIKWLGVGISKDLSEYKVHETNPSIPMYKEIKDMLLNSEYRYNNVNTLNSRVISSMQIVRSNYEIYSFEFAKKTKRILSDPLL